MQLLTLPDGTIPAGTRVPPGARLTLPTEQPPAQPGMFAVDLGDGEMVDGAWRQRWTQVPIPPAPVPASITPLQARKALRAAGLFASVTQAMASMSDEELETWEYALAIERNDPLLVTVAADLGLTEAQVDALFVQASVSG